MDILCVTSLAEKLSAEIVSIGEDREVRGFYIGDLLSHVMGKLPENYAWLTVMNNVNVAAVATLTDCAVVIICEGVKPDKALTDKAMENNINLIRTDLNIFDAVRLLAK